MLICRVHVISKKIVDVKGLQSIEGYVTKPCHSECCKHITTKFTKESSPSNNTNSKTSSVLSEFEIGDEPWSSTS
jgi:hypothetical protein